MRTTTITNKIFFLLIASSVIFSSCKKDSGTSNSTTSTLPTPISNIVPQSMIDSLQKVGAAINVGTTPPIVNGIYLMHTDSCIYDNSPGNFAGSLFDDYKFQFANQNNSAFTITVSQKDVESGISNADPVSTYISGSGNKFSIFILRTTSATGIPVQQFNILSGTLTSLGIQNFQNTLYLRSKTGDPSNTIAPAGTIRVFNNGAPGLAAISSTY